MVLIVTANSQIEIDWYRWICELAVFLARNDAKVQRILLLRLLNCVKYIIISVNSINHQC